MILRTIPASYIPSHTRTGYLRNQRARAMLHLLFPALTDRHVPRLPACDSRRMAGLPPLPSSLRTTPAPSEHEIADAYAAHPYAPKPPAWMD